VVVVLGVGTKINTLSVEAPITVVVYPTLPLVIVSVIVWCALLIVVVAGTWTVTTQGSEDRGPVDVPTAEVCVATTSVV